MTRYRVTNQAATDLKDIGRFTQRQWGLESRIEYLCRLQSVFKRLAANPNLGRVRKELPASFRIFPAGRHLVIYQIRKKDIVIIRVLHQSMDYLRMGLGSE